MELDVAPEADALLRVNGLCKRFGGVSASEDLDFRIRPGELAAIVGDNGAGKSTFIKMLAGAVRPDSGEIWFGGEKRVFDTPRDARRVGIETVFQNLAMADHLDVTANLFLGREEFRLRLGPFSILNHAKMRRKASELLAKTGGRIPDLNALLLNLSGGQRQSIAIARATGWGSQLVIMDEPTAALGVQETAHVEDIIRGLKARGIAVLIISHNLRQVFELADSIWVLRRGRMVGHRQKLATSPEEIIRLITGADMSGVI